VQRHWTGYGLEVRPDLTWIRLPQSAHSARSTVILASLKAACLLLRQIAPLTQKRASDRAAIGILSLAVTLNQCELRLGRLSLGAWRRPLSRVCVERRAIAHLNLTLRVDHASVGG